MLDLRLHRGAIPCPRLVHRGEAHRIEILLGLRLRLPVTEPIHAAQNRRCGAIELRLPDMRRGEMHRESYSRCIGVIGLRAMDRLVVMDREFARVDFEIDEIALIDILNDALPNMLATRKKNHHQGNIALRSSLSQDVGFLLAFQISFIAWYGRHKLRNGMK